MPSQNNSEHSFEISRCKGIRADLAILLFVKLLFLIASGKIIEATNEDTSNAAYTPCETGTKRRWMFGTARLCGDQDSNLYSSSWKEIVDGFGDQNSHYDLDGFGKRRHDTKSRLGLFHFGKINQLSNFETKVSNKLNEINDEKKEHPLRTNLWDLDLKWSLLSRKSKLLSRTKESKTKQREKNIQLELDPEGYCRIFERKEVNEDNDKDNSDSPVLAIGRWKKRPWGVTIVVRPLFASEYSLDATNSDDSGETTNKNFDSQEDNEIHMIDEETEFVLHANNFHWNGFGSNPKLTQGTILFQKLKRKNIKWWWKSTTLAYSSILPVWPEEVSEGNDGESSDGFGIPGSGFPRLSDILKAGMNSQKSVGTRRWFRPVVGTFTAKGIVQN
eukprot:CAMPEP_0116125714 /NCGR_PEP_ID=MMETSP0329-20121206/5955_1 /TAXON_ID=697910 /ORGANISM="Pseudo-nitzschia arenysensis, Strain B593" /LENGTH=387 /DNA_ID=CAMNT_0003619767 /DNA_START=123 /DNA_END=1286 /DNA_ORIENTATION=+